MFFLEEKATFSLSFSPQIHTSFHSTFHATVHSMFAALFHDTICSLVHVLGDYGVVDSAMRARTPETATSSSTFRLPSDVLFGAAQPSFSAHRPHGAYCSSPPRRMCGWYALCPLVDPRWGAQQPAGACARLSSY